MSTPERSTDPLHPITRAELETALDDVLRPIREMLIRIDERLISIEKHGASRDFVREQINGTIWKAVALLATLLTIATGLIIRFA